MRNEITVKHYQKGTIEHILHLKIQIRKLTELIKIHFKYCHSINMAKFNTTDLLKNHSPECDIRENFDTNECPNIFVSTKLHE